MTHHLHGKTVLVIGLGVSGRAAAQFLLRRGAKVVGIDRNQELLERDRTMADLQIQGLQVCHETYFNMDNLKHFDLVVVSPGISQTNRCYQRALEMGIEVVGEVELALREVPQPCIGITGTNGKTTVTLFVAHVLNTMGLKALAIGNIGIPITSVVDEGSSNDADVFVIELSSFQLETLKARCLDSAVLLNITPDHLDRYDSMDAYAKAKISIRNCLKTDSFFVEEKCYRSFNSLLQSSTGDPSTYGYSADCDIYSDGHAVYMDKKQQFMLPEHYQTKSSHDIENILAAYALCSRHGVSPDQFLSALLSFKKPPHRIEFVRTHGGIHYYDDSKGTNLDAVIRAVESMKGESKIILIAGGVDKGSPYTPWIAAFEGKVKAICAIGQAAKKIENDVGSEIPVTLHDTLELAVGHATILANHGDIVLLSPGCASFDMFKDYAHRGMEFQRIVNAL